MPRPLKILLTNNTLDQRAGSELYVRDVALGLLERGHTPIAYSSVLGEVAEELRQSTVAVVDDLRRLATPPDVIHGHHHLETMTALLRFHQTPALSFCHGWLPWEEAPPRFPRILRYVAVDELCRDRLVLEHGIAPERVAVLLNFVDLQRFGPRPPLPDRPRRALVFSNYATEDSYLSVLRRVCVQSGISLDVKGSGIGAPCSRPEEILGNYDLVFAKGRAALEALAVGTAVILCDRAGLGPLVTTKNLEELRRLNFGLRCLRDPVTADQVKQTIDHYDPNEAAQASNRLRGTVGRDRALDRLEALYGEVIAEHALGPARAPDAEAQAAASYLEMLAPILKQMSLRQLHQENENLRAALALAARSTALREQSSYSRLPLAAWCARMMGQITSRCRRALRKDSNHSRA